MERPPARGVAPARRRSDRSYFLLMFQNRVTGASSTPSTLLRSAKAPYHWPSGMWVGYWVARTWTCSAICFCLAGLVSRAKASRSPSMSLSHGQPNMALSHEALRKPIITGFRMSAATHEVRNAFQPPAVGGSFLARRATSVCQSIECMSTLKPAFSSSALDFSKFESSRPSSAFVDAIGEPHGKNDLQVL